MKPNIENYLEYLMSECDKIIGDIDSLGVRYGIYEDLNNSLFDSELAIKFELNETEIQTLKDYKAVILSETGNGDFEYTMYKTTDQANIEFESIEADLISYYNDNYSVEDDEIEED